MKIKELYDIVNKEEYLIKYLFLEIKNEVLLNESLIMFVDLVFIGLIIEGVKLLVDFFGFFSFK